MRILLDTHVVLSLLQDNFQLRYPRIYLQLALPDSFGIVSVASLWEMAIKARLGKLELGLPLEEMPGYIDALGLRILPIETQHVLVTVDPTPPTRDPFDRLLLAQCQSEGLLLATIDRALMDHPLALKV